MCSVHPIRLRPGDVLRYVTLVCASLLLLAACSDRTEQAAAEGAVAEQQLSAGDLQGAKRTIMKAIADRDDIVDLHLLRGRIALAQNSPEEAYDAYSDALSLDPSNSEALQGVSQLGLSTGHLEESLAATDRILLLAPNQADALLTRGVHALVRHRFDEAITYADKLLAQNPANENASVLKARALFLTGSSDAALTAIDAVHRGSAESPAVALTKLELFRELRKPDDMKAQFSRLTQLRPDDVQLRLDEANLRLKLGERARGHELVTEVLANPKASEDAVNDAIQLWVNYGSDDLPTRNLGLIGAGGTAYARQGVVRFFIESRQLDKAGTILPSLPKRDRESFSALLAAAQGNHERALNLADEVLAQDHTQCDALVAESIASIAEGKFNRALESGQRGAAECPEQVATWLANAQAYDRLNRSSGTARVYSQAFAAHPQDLRIVQSYSEWLLRQKRPREAVAIARLLTRNAPALTVGWQYYGELCRRTRSACEAEAAQGLADAKTRFGVDLPIGVRTPNSLFGRFVRR